MADTVAARLSATGTANALELRGVSRFFGALRALEDITITVAPGERRAVLGSNGAGKTTLFNCITGDFPPTAGRIRLFGEDVTAFPPYERIRRGLRRTYQISLLFTGLSVEDNVYLACRGVSRGRFSMIRPRPQRRADGDSAEPHRRRAPDRRARHRWSPTSPTASSGSWRSRSRSQAPRASSCSTSRRRASPRPSGASSSRS